MYKETNSLRQDDTVPLVLEAESKGEKELFEMIGNYLLQKGQKFVIDRNLLQ